MAVIKWNFLSSKNQTPEREERARAPARLSARCGGGLGRARGPGGGGGSEGEAGRARWAGEEGRGAARSRGVCPRVAAAGRWDPRGPSSWGGPHPSAILLRVPLPPSPPPPLPLLLPSLLLLPSPLLPGPWKRQGWSPEQPPLLLPAGRRMSQLTAAPQPLPAAPRAPRSPEVAASRPPTFGVWGTDKVMRAF